VLTESCDVVLADPFGRDSFIPVAASLRAGDHVTSLDGVTFPCVMNVVGRTVRPDGLHLFLGSDEDVREVVVEFSADVAIEPPF